MNRLKFILASVFFLPGTFLHELSHYIAALFLGSAEGFSIIPRRHGDSYVFGSVKSRTKFRILSSFVAAAPLVWWAVFVFLLIKSGLISEADGTLHYNLRVVGDKIHSFNRNDILLLWLSIQLLWAGRLSSSDLINTIKGVLSPSGVFLIVSAGALMYLVRA